MPNPNATPLGQVPFTILGRQILPAHIDAFLDTYFTCDFKAALIQNRSKLQDGIKAGTVPSHLLLAVCAVATIFLGHASKCEEKHRAELTDLGGLAPLGLECALQASYEVLTSIEKPTLSRIQTCLALGYFWYSRGDAERESVFSGLAYRAARRTLRRLKRTQQDEVGKEEIALARRLFWAGWIQTCVNSDHYVVGTTADTLALHTPLPTSNPTIEDDSGPVATLNDLISERSVGDQSAGVWVLAIRSVHLWMKVSDFIEIRKTLTPWEILENLERLARAIHQRAQSLEPGMVYSQANIFQQIVSNQLAPFASAHAMYWQARLVLHSSLVPQFNGAALSDAIPAHMVRRSADIALQCARDLAALARDLQTFSCDLGTLAPFVGYCMYVAATVLLAASDRNDSLGERSQTDLASCVEILDGMRPFWANLEGLWTRLQVLIEAHESRFADPFARASMPNSRVLRDTGRLAEPLEDSILSYHLNEKLPSANRQRSESGLPFLPQSYGDDWWQLQSGSSEPQFDVEDLYGAQYGI